MNEKNCPNCKSINEGFIVHYDNGRSQYWVRCTKCEWGVTASLFDIYLDNPNNFRECKSKILKEELAYANKQNSKDPDEVKVVCETEGKNTWMECQKRDLFELNILKTILEMAIGHEVINIADKFSYRGHEFEMKNKFSYMGHEFEMKMIGKSKNREP